MFCERAIRLAIDETCQVAPRAERMPRSFSAREMLAHSLEQFEPPHNAEALGLTVRVPDPDLTWDCLTVSPFDDR
jgi:hypothetical protein